MIRYYGVYSSRSKGRNKENGINDKFGVKVPDTQDILADDELESLDFSSKEKFKQTWAKLIQKVYEVDPLICPHCKSEMKVIAIIFDKDEIKKILSCLRKNKAPPFDKIEFQEEVA